MKIPQNIHQIWFQGIDDIPQKYTPNIASIKTLAPDWKYYYWDETGLFQQCLLYSERCAKKFINYKHMHQKMDLARYAILYNLGGIYIDMDCELLKPLSTIPGLTKHELIISRLPGNYLENMFATGSVHKKSLNNGVILSSPKNIYMKKLIDAVVDFDSDSSFNPLYKNKQYCIYKTTGPHIFTHIFDQYKNDPNVLILDHEYFEPCFSANTYCTISDKTIINHKQDLSWVSTPMITFFKSYFHVKNFVTNNTTICLFSTCCIILIIIILSLML